MPGVGSVILEEYFEGSLSPSFPVEVIVTFSEVDVGIFVVFFCSVFCCWVIMSIVLAWSPTISSLTSALWKCFEFYNKSNRLPFVDRLLTSGVSTRRTIATILSEAGVHRRGLKPREVSHYDK